VYSRFFQIYQNFLHFFSPTPDIKFNEEKVGASSSSSAGPSSAPAPSTVDQSKPTTSIQIRLGDGTR
jgi:hypothetical protein